MGTSRPDSGQLKKAVGDDLLVSSTEKKEERMESELKEGGELERERETLFRWRGYVISIGKTASTTFDSPEGEPCWLVGGQYVEDSTTPFELDKSMTGGGIHVPKNKEKRQAYCVDYPLRVQELIEQSIKNAEPGHNKA